VIVILNTFNVIGLSSTLRLSERATSTITDTLMFEGLQLCIRHWSGFSSSSRIIVSHAEHIYDAIRISLSTMAGLTITSWDLGHAIWTCPPDCWESSSNRKRCMIDDSFPRNIDTLEILVFFPRAVDINWEQCSPENTAPWRLSRLARKHPHPVSGKVVVAHS
jgi:hypothetical protein